VSSRFVDRSEVIDQIATFLFADCTGVIAGESLPVSTCITSPEIEDAAAHAPVRVMFEKPLAYGRSF